MDRVKEEALLEAQLQLEAKHRRNRVLARAQDPVQVKVEWDSVLVQREHTSNSVDKLDSELDCVER